MSRISIVTGISSAATFATFICLPVSISLGAASLTGVIASGIISALTKKYQKKLKKVTKLIDIITPALVVFERVASGMLKNGIIDEKKFNMLQMLHLETLNELTGVDRGMEVEHRSLVEKSLLEEINNTKKNAGTKLRNDKYIMMQYTNWINSTPSQQQLLSCIAQWLEHWVYNPGVVSLSLTFGILTVNFSTGTRSFCVQ